ncbi:MAG: hypothetical protein ACOC1F_00270 [Myxococcota bacterium]
MLPDGSRRSRTWAACPLLLLASSAFACSSLSPCDTSDDANPPDPYYDGTTVDGYFMSSEWGGDWLPFTAGKRYDFYHGLGCTPRFVMCNVSFSSRGVENGSFAHSAGNLCVVQDVNEQYIRVKNDTCSEMYVMVTAEGPPCDAVSDAGSNPDGG